MQKIAFVICVCSIVMLSGGCGWLKDRAKSDTVDASSMLGDCQLDFDRLKNFFSEDLSTELDCLEQNLLVYRKSVRHVDRNYLDAGDLSLFINRYLISDQEIDLTYLYAGFAVKSLILGGRRDAIEYEVLGHYLDIAKLINREVVHFRHEMENNRNRYLCLDESLYVKNLAFESAKRISQGINRIVKGKKKQGSPFDLRFLVDVFMSSDFLTGLRQADKILFFKSMILGGKNEILTQEEFYFLLEKLPLLSGTLYDLFVVNDVNVENLKNFFMHDIRHELRVLEENLLVFLSVRKQNEETEPLPFTRSDLEMILESFEGLELDPIMVEVVFEFKTLLLGGSDDAVKYHNIRPLMDVLKILNGEIFPIAQMLESEEGMTGDEFFAGREKVEKAAFTISVGIDRIINGKEYPGMPFDLRSLTKLATDLGYQELAVRIKNFLKYKPYIVGGSEETLTRREFNVLLKKLPNLSSALWDLVFAERKYFESRWKYWNFMRRSFFSLIGCSIWASSEGDSKRSSGVREEWETLAFRRSFPEAVFAGVSVF